MNTIKEYKPTMVGSEVTCSCKADQGSKEYWLAKGFNPEILKAWFEEVKPKEPERIKILDFFHNALKNDGIVYYFILTSKTINLEGKREIIEQALNGETYSKDRVYELLRDLADQTIFMTPNNVPNINSWVQNWFESVEQKRIIEEQSKIK